MNINVQAFLDSLPLMAKGMAGIFLVTGLIVLSIYILGRLDANAKKGKESGEEN